MSERPPPESGVAPTPQASTPRASTPRASAPPASAPAPAGEAVVAYLAADLIWASKIKSTGDAIGVVCRPVRTSEMLEARLADCPLRGLIVDLSAGPAALEMIEQARGRTGRGQARPLTIVAFGPHVAVAELAEASRRGASAVLARGALHANLPGVLKTLAAGGGVASQLED